MFSALSAVKSFTAKRQFGKARKGIRSEGAGGNARASRFFIEEALERKRLPGISRLPLSFR
jgi:hypothetical protein